MLTRSSTAYDFAGTVVAITAAASGIGRKTAELFARSGATVALMDLSPSVAEAASVLGPTHQGEAVDVSDAASVASGLTYRAGTARGRLESVVKSAASWKA